MGTKNVRLDEDVYERIKSQKRDDETFSDAIDRLTGEYTLLDFAAEFDDEDSGRWETERELIEATEDEDESVERLLHDE
ncbi:antitoxin VapB family protein [Salinirubellus salinus]|uniref:Antitoxin VapB family protein n=1 Tax=Salinirubellus salinus TaxID=1364945 RepID=A0A9E7QZE7_9EURY|nr:antitoxin VapB family protein [Salinirubellus salinus]UWM52762.1 antitoxin VapB family protein [Salinirubellus salinus]